MMDAYIISNSCISAQDTFDGSSFINQNYHPESGQLKAIEPNYKEFIPPKLSRRMARIIKMSVASAMECLKSADVEQPEAIITGTGLGCLKDTEKFLADMIQNKEETLSPTPFIQSTHNTIAGQIALLLKCNSYNYTYAHRGFSFESALDDALLQLNEGRNNILVGGMDEFTDSSHDIIQKMNCYSPNVQGEGASFFLLSNEKRGENPILIRGFQMIYNPDDPKEIINHTQNMLSSAGLSSDQIDAVLTGSNQHPEKDKWYQSLIHEISTPLFTCFKNLCGEYPTASAFGLNMACQMLKENKVFPGSAIKGSQKGELKNILIYNHYVGKNHALYLISKD